MEQEKRFEAAVGQMITRTLRETNYRPTLFMQMVSDRGAMDACLSLVRAPRPSDGFTRLWGLQRLDLTVEALVLQPAFAGLFASEDIARAKRRLAEYGFTGAKL